MSPYWPPRPKPRARPLPRTLYEIYAEDFDYLKEPMKETPMTEKDWQRIVDQLQGAIDVIRPVASDPASSPEDQTEAQHVLVVLESCLQHLFERHKVKPAPPDLRRPGRKP